MNILSLLIFLGVALVFSSAEKLEVVSKGDANGIDKERDHGALRGGQGGVLMSNRTLRMLKGSCETDCLDFSDVKHGEWVKYNWLEDYGMSIEVYPGTGGLSFEGTAAVFDTSLYDTEDPDLGSPNHDCPGGGPGIGDGGKPNQQGENCVPQGNVLIIQEDLKPGEAMNDFRPDDNAYGGLMEFRFDSPGKKIHSIDLLDLEEELLLKITKANGYTEKRIAGLGDNAFQKVLINEDNITTLALEYPHSLGISAICFCVEKPVVPPDIAVIRIADPASLPAPGGAVTFETIVINTSVSAVTMDTLEDSIYGNLNNQGDCVLPQIIQPGVPYSCKFTADVVGSAGDTSEAVVTASAVDSRGNRASESALATVTLTDSPDPCIPYEALIEDPDPELADPFALSANAGRNLALNGDGTCMVVGSPFRGTVDVYNLVGSTWSLTARLHELVPGSKTWHLFGQAVAVSKDCTRAVVSDSYRRAVVFDQSASGTWQQTVTIKAPVAEPTNQFFMLVSMTDDGSRIALGVPYTSASPPSGAVIVYDVSTTGAVNRVSLTKFSGSGGDLAISGDGSRFIISSVTNAGASANVYNDDGSVSQECDVTGFTAGTDMALAMSGDSGDRIAYQTGEMNTFDDTVSVFDCTTGTVAEDLRSVAEQAGLNLDGYAFAYHLEMDSSGKRVAVYAFGSRPSLPGRSLVFEEVDDHWQLVSQLPDPGSSSITDVRPGLALSVDGLTVAGPGYVRKTCPGDPLVTCETDCLDFSTFEGKKVKHGDWVKYEWVGDYGMAIEVYPGPGGESFEGWIRVFDTSLYNTEDPDLGSPNHDCPGGGPGIGDGGKPNQPGENCVPQGNVLIIQDGRSVRPNDNAYGGLVEFRFHSPGKKIHSIDLLDLEEELVLKIYKTDVWDDHDIEKRIAGLGDNAFQKVLINEDKVTMLALEFPNSLGISAICFCV